MEDLVGTYMGLWVIAIVTMFVLAMYQAYKKMRENERNEKQAVNEKADKDEVL